MVENPATKTAAGMSTAAAVFSALAWLKAGSAQAAGIPNELMELIIALAQSSEELEATTRAILEALANGMGWPENTETGVALRVTIPIGGIQIPSIPVPSGMAVLVSAWPLNPGWVHVAFSLPGCVSVEQSYPLLPGQNVSYAVKNADAIYVGGLAGGGGAPIAGCFANVTVEQRQGGIG